MKTLFDLRGLVIQSLHMGEDADTTKTVSGTKLNTVGHCLNNFITQYLNPALENCRLNDIVAVTEGGNQFRLALYPEYKANRNKVNPDPVKAQGDEQVSARVRECMITVEEFLKGMGIPSVSVAGAEADDVLAYLVRDLPGPKLVYTVDQDLIQLASPTCGVFVKSTFTDKYALKNNGIHLMDVLPRHVALCKSIIGDSSDNYKGVPNMGPAAFLALAETFGEDGLDELVKVVSTSDFNGMLKEAVNQTGDKNLQKLYDNTEAWRLGWRLANLNPDLVGAREGNKFNNLSWVKRVPSRERVEALLAQHGCRHLLPKLANLLPRQTLITSANVPELSWLRSEFERSPFVSLDWETSDEVQHPAFKEALNGREFVDMLSSTITGAGFTFGENLQHTIYISFDHADTDNVSRDFLLEVLDIIPEDKLTVIQNTYFEINILKANTGFSIPNTADTKVMASYVDENMTSGLKDRSLYHLGYRQIRYEDVIEKGKRMKDYSAEHVFQYGADDPLVTAHLFDHYKMIMQLEGTFDFFLENENLPIEILSDGFIAGVSVDWQELDRQAVEDRAEYAAAMGRVRELLRENQTPEIVSSGADRLFEEDYDEAEAKAKVKYQAAMEKYQVALEEFQVELLAQDPESPTKKKLKEPVQPLEEQIVNEAIDDLREKCVRLATYRDFEVIEEPKEFDLTVTALNPVLDKLGIPRITKDLAAELGYAPKDIVEKGPAARLWVDTHVKPLGLDFKVQAMFEDMVLAAEKNGQTSAAKVKAGEGRGHIHYKLFVQQALEYVDAKTRTEGSELNLGSPVQMKGLLYGMLDLPIRMRGFEISETRKKLGLERPTAQANEDALITAMAEDCHDAPWKKEVLEHIHKARKCQTRLSLFYNVYPLWRHPIDDMIHPQVNSCGTETRRPTGSSPNPLQWPKRGDGVKFRRCILPNAKLGHDVIVSIDWSQQELRVAGALSMDEVLLDCYIGKDVEHVISDETKALLGEALMARFLSTGTKDVHTQTATGLLKWAYEEVEAALNGTGKDLAKKAKAARTNSKPINFGSTYGIGAAKLARQLICPVEEAKQYLDDKKQLYHQFEGWRDSIIDLVQRQGYVTTALGNRRHVFDGVTHEDEGFRQSVYRQVVNYLIQGVCADNLKRTLSEIYRQGILQRTGSVLIAPIYDEVVFSCHHSQAVDLIMSVHPIMVRDIPGMAVPMLAEPSLGVNFGDQVEIGRFPTPEAIDKAMREAFHKPSQRRLVWHPESEALFEIWSDYEWEQVSVECEDVTGVPKFEGLVASETRKEAA